MCRLGQSLVPRRRRKKLARASELDDVAVLQAKRVPQVVFRNHFEYVRVVRADWHDDRAIDVARCREEAFRAAEGAARGFEARDLDPRALLKALELRQVRPAHLQMPRPLVRLDPELLSELVLVASLAHVEGALPEAA